MKSKRIFWITSFLMVMVTWVGCSKKTETQASVSSQSGNALVYVMEKKFPLHVPVAINGRPYTFFLDTGCSISIFNSTLREHLGECVEILNQRDSLLRESPIERINIPENVTFLVGLTRIQGRVGCKDFKSLNPTFHDYDGIIGMDFLRQAVFQINFESNQISLFFNKTDLDRDQWGQPFSILITDDHYTPWLELQLTDRVTESFMIDTGSPTTLLRQELFTQLMTDLFPDTEYTPKPIDPERTSLSAIPLKNIMLQNTSCGQLTIVENPRSLIGLDFFNRYALVTFDFPDKTLYLKPKGTVTK